MFISTRRGTRLAAVLGVTAAVVVGLAAPASAAANNEALGIQATGLVDAGPFAHAAFPAGPTTSTLLEVTVPGLLSSKTVNADAHDTDASARVEDLKVNLSPLVTLAATAVSAECTYNPSSGVLKGSSSIADAAVALPAGAAPITLNAAAAPNTEVTVPGIASIVLNKQVSDPDGSLTVDAIYIDLLDSTQVIRIATATCVPEKLEIPVIAPQFAAGAGALGLLALGFVLYRRRQSAVDAT